MITNFTLYGFTKTLTMDTLPVEGTSCTLRVGKLTDNQTFRFVTIEVKKPDFTEGLGFHTTVALIIDGENRDKMWESLRPLLIPETGWTKCSPPQS